MNMTSKPKVICLGLARTGTSSLMVALNILGFGPCYHMSVVLENGKSDEIDTWFNLGQGSATLDDLQALLKDYTSVLDYPAAMYYDKLYQVYPDAKFILTTRDPAKWATSMRATVLKIMDELRPDSNSNPRSFWSALYKWHIIERLDRYHEGRLHTETASEIVAHNQRVMQLIPANKLLVYEVNQGWEPLVKFLGVEKPDMAFPCINNTTEFLRAGAERKAKASSESE